MTKTDTENTGGRRNDIIVWFISMLFIIAILGAMWGWGVAAGWYALSGYYHVNGTNETEQRFLPEPWACDEYDNPGRSGEGCSSTWYYWQLENPDTLTRAIVWLCYSLHQVLMWGLIYRAQIVVTFRREKGQPKYSTNLRWFNWSLLFVNALFHVLHLVQTHWTYDGTAQDVAISSSQASVIMMITFILLIEYKDRGFMLMWPNPKSDDKAARYLRLAPGPIQLIRKYHGFAFSWATLYTFWYHPMENTWGHTFGFFHTAIVMLQGSLIYTDMHLNRYWRFVNETWVFVHGTLVAIQTGNPNGNSAWPIFCFGFGFIVAFTQVFGLPFWKNISPYYRAIPVLVFLGTVCILCGTVLTTETVSGFSRIYEMFFIPAEEYAMFFVSFLFIYGALHIESWVIGNRPTQENIEISAIKQAAYVCVVVIIYALFVVLSYVFKNADGNLIVLMIIYVLIFCFGVSITIMIFKKLMGPNRKLVKSSAQIENENVFNNNNNNNSSVAGNTNDAYLSEGL